MALLVCGNNVFMKEIGPYCSEVLDDVNKRVKHVWHFKPRDERSSQGGSAKSEMQAFDEAAKKLKHVHFSKMKKLNVGDHFFSTSLATLKNDLGREFWIISHI